MTDVKEKTTPAPTNKTFFETEAEEAMGIETVVYENGNTVKKVKLLDGREAIVRTLFGRDAKETGRRCAGNQEDYLNAQISVATKIDGQQAHMEDIDNLQNKDYNKLMVANTSLNF